MPGSTPENPIQLGTLATGPSDQRPDALASISFSLEEQGSAVSWFSFETWKISRFTFNIEIDKPEDVEAFVNFLLAEGGAPAPDPDDPDATETASEIIVFGIQVATDQADPELTAAIGFSFTIAVHPSEFLPDAGLSADRLLGFLSFPFYDDVAGLFRQEEAAVFDSPLASGGDLLKSVVLADGNIAHVWRGGPQQEAFVAVTTPDGTPVTDAPVRIRGDLVDQPGDQFFLDTREPAIEALPDGGFVAGFARWRNSGEENAYYLRRFDADGTPQDEVERFTGLAGGFQIRELQILSWDDGSYAAVWRNATTDNTQSTSARYEAQRFTADGDPVGAPFVIADPIDAGTATLRSVDFTALADGTLVAAWTDEVPGADYIDDGQDHPWRVYLQRFDTDGQPLGDPRFAITREALLLQEPGTPPPSDMGAQYDPVIRPLSDGGFVVGVEAFRAADFTSGQAGSGQGGRSVWLQRYDADGEPEGDSIQVTPDADFSNRLQDIGQLADGSLAVTFTNTAQVASQIGEQATVRGQIVEPDGTLRGEAFDIADGILSARLAPFQTNVMVTPLEGGEFVVTSSLQEGSPQSTGALELQVFNATGQPVSAPVPLPVARNMGLESFGTLALPDGNFLASFGAGVRTMQFSAPINAAFADSDAGVELVGSDGNDFLQGGAGDDTLQGGPGDDILIGGGGVNTAVYSGDLADYDIQDLGQGVTAIIDLRPGSPDGSDLLRDINLLSFADQTVMLGGPGETVEIAGQIQVPGGIPAGASLLVVVDGGVSAPIPIAADGGFELDIATEVLTAPGADLIYDPGTGTPQLTANNALEALRLAVGLDPSWGTASAVNFIAADINRDGQVTASDALDILRNAVGLETPNLPRWVLVDMDHDFGPVSNTAVPQDAVLDLATLLDGSEGLSLAPVLLGQVSEFSL